MTDSLRLLATVAHLQAQDSASSLEKIAADQKSKISEKKTARDIQQKYSEIMADDQVTASELATLQSMMSAAGVDFAATSGMALQDGVYKTGDSSDATQRVNKQEMEKLKNTIDGHMDGLNDDQQLLQFEIQMATSEMQNAESTRSQAEKRLEDQRKDLRRNWAG